MSRKQYVVTLRCGDEVLTRIEPLAPDQAFYCARCGDSFIWAKYHAESGGRVATNNRQGR